MTKEQLFKQINIKTDHYKQKLAMAVSPSSIVNKKMKITFFKTQVLLTRSTWRVTNKK